MGDIAQILSGAAATAASSSSELPPPPPPPPVSHHPSRAMKMTGMSREVMDLLTGSQEKKSATLPPMVPTIPPKMDTKTKVGNKYISASKPARKWVWAPFTSSARTDGALFRHWVRDGVEYPDYPYARFDIHLDPVAYTEEEYRRYLQDDSWTKSETDKLMEMARCFELRWPVIFDRWCDAAGSRQVDRCVEDLQYRYYHVAAVLSQIRVAKEAATEAASLAANQPTADPSRGEDANAVANNHLMETAAARALATTDPKQQPFVVTIGTGTTNKKVFDLQKEKERRRHLEFIWNRTKEEELEEAQLRKELRLLDTQIRKLKKSGGHILAASAANSAAGTGATASKMSSAASSANPSRSSSPVTNINITTDSALLDECFLSTAPTPMPGTPYLQSGRLVPPATGGPVGLNKTTLKRMENVLAELSIPVRPIPTKRVCDLYDTVRKDALTLLTLQKMTLQREGQLQTKRLRLAKLGGGGRVVDEDALLGIAPPAPAPAPPPATGSVAAAAAAAVAASANAPARGKVAPSPALATKGKGARGVPGKKAASATKPRASVEQEKTETAVASAAPQFGGKQVPGKSARKTSNKRKRKSAPAGGDAAKLAPEGGEGRNRPGEVPGEQAPKPTKKRARKST